MSVQEGGSARGAGKAGRGRLPWRQSASAAAAAAAGARGGTRRRWAFARLRFWKHGYGYDYIPEVKP
jgi:hypothetical protein